VAFSVESAHQVHMHYVYVFVVNLCVLHYHYDGGEGVVDAANESEAGLLLAEDAAGFCILRACVFDKCSP
jgi:hypothetical protein